MQSLIFFVMLFAILYASVIIACLITGTIFLLIMFVANRISISSEDITKEKLARNLIVCVMLSNQSVYYYNIALKMLFSTPMLYYKIVNMGTANVDIIRSNSIEECESESISSYFKENFR